MRGFRMRWMSIWSGWRGRRRDCGCSCAPELFAADVAALLEAGGGRVRRVPAARGDARGPADRAAGAAEARSRRRSRCRRSATRRRAILDTIKSLSYAANMLVTRLAQEQGADEALLVTPHGRVLEGPRQSFVCSLDGETLVTPPLSDHVLDSITRRRVLETGLVTERSISADELPFATRGVPRRRRRARCTRSTRSTASRLAAGAGAADERRRRPRARGHRGGGQRVKVVTVIGNRPQFVKAAAVSRLLREQHDELLVHTGQHYDDELSTVFVEELGIPRPERELGIGGGSNTEQTARMLTALGPLLDERAPGRACSSTATRTRRSPAASAAAQRAGAGRARRGGACARSTAAMPEELNRVLTDHLSDLLLVPDADRRREPRARVGRRPHRARRRRDGRRRRADPPARAGRRRAAAPRRASSPAATCSRRRTAPGNVDDPAAPARRSSACCARRSDLPVVLPLHPRTRARLEAAGLLDALVAGDRVRVLPPLGLRRRSPRCSRARPPSSRTPAGVQKEAYLAGVRCVTLRDTTEWVETVDAGWNTLVDLDVDAARAALARRAPGRAARAVRRRPCRRARRGGARHARRLTAQARGRAEAHERDAGARERRRVEDAAPVEHRARARDVRRAERAVRRVVGLDDRRVDRLARPTA